MASVICVRKESLRKLGFESLEAWLSADPKHVYIGRSNPHVAGASQSKWNNPFKVDRLGRAGCIAEFAKYVVTRPDLMGALHELDGCVLGCWCKPEACHGDVLVRLVSGDSAIALPSAASAPAAAAAAAPTAVSAVGMAGSKRVAGGRSVLALHDDGEFPALGAAPIAPARRRR
jgi:hypothetical protein